jgi:hypothetical protein
MSVLFHDTERFAPSGAVVPECSRAILARAIPPPIFGLECGVKRSAARFGKWYLAFSNDA